MSGQANAITRAPTRAPEESLSPLNEIALQNPIPEQNETFTSRHWQVISGGAGVCALGTAILSGFHLSPALEYLTPIAVGIFAHIAFELATPRRISKPVDNWLAGYALTEFLLLTLLYLNLYDFFDPGHDSGNHVLDKAGQWILGFMLAGGGTWVSVKAFKIAQKPKSDDARLPLINTDIQRLRAFCSSDTAAYGIKIGFQASTGITFIALGATFSNGYAIDIGSFVLGDVGGQALEKMLHELDQHLKGRRGEKAWAVIHKLFDILGRNFLGPLFVANHPAAYATIGALYGKSRSTVYRRFGESDLRRIKDFPPERPVKGWH